MVRPVDKHANQLHSIVTIHDLYGHPWYSFALQNDEGCEEENWLLDHLPRVLENGSQEAVHARVMTFGYRTDVWITQPMEKLKEIEESFLQHLQEKRRSVYSLNHLLPTCG